MEMGSISIQGGILLLRAFPEKLLARTLIRGIIMIFGFFFLFFFWKTQFYKLK